MEPSTPETEAPQGITEEQAVSQLLERYKPEAEKPKAKPDEPEAEETTEDSEPKTPKGDAEAEEETEESDAEEDDGEIEIDVGGKKFKAPKAIEETFRQVEAQVKEIEAGATRKFQAAADLQKAVETQAQSVKQLQKFAEANADLLADHRMVVKRLHTLESLDINSLDETLLPRLSAEHIQLRAAKERIEAQYAQNAEAAKAEDKKVFASKREFAEKVLASKIKGWGPEKAKSLSEYAMARGAPAEALNSISEAWMVEILDDAAYGRKMRESKPELTKRVAETPKTLKPGATGTTKHANATKANELVAKAKKTGHVDDAVMALLARSQSRKR